MMTIDKLIAQLDAIETARRAGCGDIHREMASDVIEQARDGVPKEILARALRVLGQLERDAGHLEAALQAYSEAADILSDLHLPLAYAHTLRHVAELHIKLKEPSPARTALTTVLEIYSRNFADVSSLEMANTIRIRALLHKYTFEPAEEKLNWQYARALYEEAGVVDGVQECEVHLAALESGE